MSTITNIEFNGRWLSKGKIEIESGELVWWRKELIWKWYIIPKIVKQYYSVPIKDIAYIVPYKSRIKSILGPLWKYTRTMVGTKLANEDFDIHINNYHIKSLFNTLEENGAPAMSVLDTVITENIDNTWRIHKRKSVFSPVSLWIYPEVIIESSSAQRVVCNEARFFSNSRVWRPWPYLPLIKLSKKSTYFGFLDQINMALSSNDSERIKKHLIDNGAPFAREQHMSVGSSWTLDLLYKPQLWFVRERMATTDEAVIYQKRSFSGTEMMYVPYSDMSFVRAKSRLGLLPARLYMLGQQNIITLKKFSAKQLKTLCKEFENHMHTRFNRGKVISPCWLARLSGNFSSAFMAISEDGFAMSGKSKDPENPQSKTRKYFGFVPTHGVSKWCFVRKHWYSLVGALWLKGNYGNIRKDQESKFSCYITGIAIWRYRFLFFFKGYIYKRLMSEIKDAYLKERKARKEIKNMIFNIVEKDEDSSLMATGSSLGESFADEIFKNI